VQGAALAVAQLERGEARVEIQYRRAVRPEGNPAARALSLEVFEVVDRPWRGIGVVPAGGLALREAWAAFDAERLFPELAGEAPPEPRSAAPATCCAVRCARPSARPSARAARPSARSAPDGLVGGRCAAYFRYRVADDGASAEAVRVTAKLDPKALASPSCPRPRRRSA